MPRLPAHIFVTSTCFWTFPESTILLTSSRSTHNKKIRIYPLTNSIENLLLFYHTHKTILISSVLLTLVLISDNIAMTRAPIYIAPCQDKYFTLYASSSLLVHFAKGSTANDTPQVNLFQEGVCKPLSTVQQDSKVIVTAPIISLYICTASDFGVT